MARDLRHLLIAVAVTAAATLAFGTVRVPAGPAAGVLAVPVQGGHPVTLLLEGDRTAAHRVMLTYGGRRAAVVLRGPTAARTVEVPHRPATGRLEVQVDPAAPVRVVEGSATGGGDRLVWTPLAIPAVLPRPVPRDPVTGFALAAIDERDVYGVRAFGVPLRTAPSVEAPQVGTVFHGDVFQAVCWRIGDRVSTAVAVPRPGVYSSRIWFRIRQWSGEPAYVPDTRFSRTAREGRLDLPRCAQPPE